MILFMNYTYLMNNIINKLKVLFLKIMINRNYKFKILILDKNNVEFDLYFIYFFI